ncbi:MAG: hypothetical protein WB735_10620, partial [Pseudonocardiaceae bacterium]
APPHSRMPALHVSGAGRGISRACSARRDVHRARDPAVIGPTLTVAVGQATTVPPARHSTGWGAVWVQAVKLYPVRWSRSGLWRSHRRHAGRAAPPVGGRWCGR